jgi:hypothetical protein
MASRALQGVISQKIELFITTSVVKTSDPTEMCVEAVWKII